MEAIKNNGRALKYASDRLKGDRDVVMEGVRQNIHTLYFASDDLKTDPEFIKGSLFYRIQKEF